MMHPRVHLGARPYLLLQLAQELGSLSPLRSLSLLMYLHVIAATDVMPKAASQLQVDRPSSLVSVRKIFRHRTGDGTEGTRKTVTIIRNGLLLVCFQNLFSVSAL